MCRLTVLLLKDKTGSKGRLQQGVGTSSYAAPQEIKNPEPIVLLTLG